MKAKVLILSGLLMTMNFVYSQVGINTENPNELTELDVTNLINSEGEVVPKGIMIPRMTEAERKKIDITDLDKANSLMIYNTDEDCYNYYSKEAEEWQSLCGKVGKAVISQIYCDEIDVYGNYIASVLTTPQEYIIIPVEVTKPGQYSITVKAMYDDDTDNGYSFTGTGEFHYSGKRYVTLTAQGKPINEHFSATNPDEGDNMVFFFNGVNDPTLQCQDITIPVTGALANYSVRCGTANVHGIYTVLPDPTNSDNETHYIEVQVDVNDISNGNTAGWSATTNTVNGLSFKGSGKFTIEGERQKIKLYAVEGSKANTYESIVLEVTFQTKTGSTSCHVTVRPAFTRKKIVSFGSTSAFGYSAYRGTSAAFLKSNKNFGNADNSTVKMVATNTPTSGNAAEGRYVDYNAFQFMYGGDAVDATKFRNALNTNPDIIMIAYNASWDDTAADLALDYMNKGGIIIEFSESSGVLRILKKIFGRTSIARNTNNTTEANRVGSSEKNYIQTTLPTIVDPIIEGPFQPIINGEQRTTLGGLNIAGDTENRVYSIGNIPTSGIVNYGYATVFPEESYCFRIIGQRYVYFGDGGFLTNNDDSKWRSHRTEPFATSHDFTGDSEYNDYTPRMRPDSSPSGSSGDDAASYTNVANSYFFGNVMAWAIQEAQFNGINAH